MEITAQIVSEFREFYPEFNKKIDWSDAILTKFLSLADEETNSSRWGNYTKSGVTYTLKKQGMFAYAAHRVVLQARATQIVRNGGVAPGPSQVQSKTVGDESITYVAAVPDYNQSVAAGDLRATIYGVEFSKLRNRAGMGAVVV